MGGYELTTLSFCIIAKQEEEIIETCLKSIKNADEIVIVDTGSTDKTKEIARKYTDKIYDFPWIDDFAAARNYALSKCTGDWVFHIDCDDELEPDGINKIKQLLNGIEDGIEVINIRCQAKGGPDNHISPRLHKRLSYIQWIGATHSWLTQAGQLQSDITINYVYSPAHRFDPDINLRILTKVYDSKDCSPRDIFYLAKEYVYRQKYEDAIRYYDEYLSKSSWFPEMAEAWFQKAKCLWYLSRGEEARDACLQAMKYNPSFREAFQFMSEIVWPDSAVYWRAYAMVADNKNTLFIR